MLDFSQSTELDLQTADTLGELADALRSELSERPQIEPTLDAAVRDQVADA